MSKSMLSGCRIAGVSSCVPSKVFNNLEDAVDFPLTEVRKVVAMAGVSERRVSDGTICSSDLCAQAASDLMSRLGWDPASIDGLIMITQSPDYFLPSTSCLIHRKLGLSVDCATFDVGLGCSGYTYGLWLASMMLQSGHQRVLVLHGETPSYFTSPEDRATFLLFGDAGSATALEKTSATTQDDMPPWYFTMYTDGSGYGDLIMRGGGFRERHPDDPQRNFLQMSGTNVFNFTIKRVPSLIQDTLDFARCTVEDVDYFVFHQSNRFIMKHLMKKCGLPEEKVPITLERFGNTGGPSVPLTITQGVFGGSRALSGGAPLTLLLLGYGVGLSWGAGLVTLDADVVIAHSEMDHGGLFDE